MPTLETEKKKKKFKVPNVYIIIMGMAFLAMLLTWIIPAGAYDRVINDMGREVVDPATFHMIDANPQGLFKFFQSFHTGLAESAGIIFFLFIVGGSFAVIEATGAIEAGLCKVTRSMAGKERIIIPVVMFAFALCGATIGMAEEALPFIPIMVTLAISMGFDSMTGAAMVSGRMLCRFCGRIPVSVYGRYCTGYRRSASSFRYGFPIRPVCGYEHRNDYFRIQICG